LVINEVLAAADTVMIGGIPSDYIELANRGTTVIDLGGMQLTDGLAEADAYTFPSGTTIPPEGFLLLLATDISGEGLRNGFKLDSDGETVSLLQPDGTTVIDQVTFGCQIVDLSIGRNASDRWTLNTPTPNATNSEAAFGDVNTLRINEWLTTTETLYRDDHVELYNAEGNPVALGGIALRREP